MHLQTSLLTLQIEDIETVDKLSVDKSVVKYTMCHPRVRQNACTCEAATQGYMCTHQVAWLLMEYPYGTAAEKLMAKMLGSSFGYSGGCSLLDISALIDGFNELEWRDVTERNDCRLPSRAEDRRTTPNVPPPPTDPSTQKVLGPGHTAVQNRLDRLRGMVESMRSQLDSTPAHNCAAIMRTQSEQMCALVRLAQKPAGEDPIASAANFQKKGDTNMRRHKSYLERSHTSKHYRTVLQLADSNNLQQACPAPRDAQMLHTDADHACVRSIKPLQETF
jgi:hypothetical protein